MCCYADMCPTRSDFYTKAGESPETFRQGSRQPSGGYSLEIVNVLLVWRSSWGAAPSIRFFSIPSGYPRPRQNMINMLSQNEGTSESYQLLDVDSREQQGPSTLMGKSLATASSVKVTDEQGSAFQVGLDDQPPIQPPGWISKPEKLGKSRKSLSLDVALNVFMMLIPLPFVILAAAVALAHGKPTTPSKTDALLQATKTARVTFTALP